jgi:hypothetical protein
MKATPFETGARKKSSSILWLQMYLKQSGMNRNTLFAVIAICATISILACAYVLTIYRQPGTTAATGPLSAAAESRAIREVDTAFASAGIASGKETESEVNEVVSARKVTARVNKKQEVITHLNKYLNFVPSSNPVSPDGFNNIYFSVVNSSDYTFDEVAVNFRCFLSNGKLWNEKTYLVGPIAPHSRVEQLVPDQSRGHSIKWQTVSIKSSELDFYWPQ